MQFLASAALAFLVSIALTGALRPLAIRIRLIDKPGGRKRHVGEIPLVGGIAMLIGFIVGAALLTDTVMSIWHLIAPAAILVVVGVIDDRWGIRAIPRLAAQAAASLIMMLGGGLYLRDIGNPFGMGTIELGLFALPFTVIVTLTVINAWNFIDGIDGLAASLAVIVLLAGALSAGFIAPASALALTACAAILGFFVYNFPGLRKGRMRAFMGDAGSTLLGFLVVWLTLTICVGEGQALSPVAALWFALVPLADFFSSIVRRVFKRRSPLAPDREHFHHQLLRAGLSARQTLAVLVAFALTYACIGLAGARLGVPDIALFAPWALLLVSQYFIIKRLALLIRGHRLASRRTSGRDAAGASRPLTR